MKTTLQTKKNFLVAGMALLMLLPIFSRGQNLILNSDFNSGHSFTATTNHGYFDNEQCNERIIYVVEKYDEIVDKVKYLTTIEHNLEINV